MITGAHVILYSTNPDADRAFLRDVLTLTNVDVGDGWLIHFACRMTLPATQPKRETAGRGLCDPA